MSELAKKFFEADLNNAEDLALEAELEHSPEAADAFAEAALAHYASLGLPEPNWNRRGLQHLKKAAWPLALLFGAGLLYSMWPKGSHEAWFEETRLDLKRVEAAAGQEETKESPYKERAAEIRKEEAAKALPQVADEGLASGTFVSVVVKQKRVGEAEVWVEDSEGRKAAQIFDGELAQGEHRFSWDGHLDGGKTAPLGHYVMLVKRGENVMRKQFVMKGRLH